MPSSTLVIADYPVGYASGFGETLFNLFSGFPDEKLWSAHLGHLSVGAEKRKGHSVRLPSPSRPKVIPSNLSLSYYPFLKAQQYWAAKRSVQMLDRLIEQHSDQAPTRSAGHTLDTFGGDRSAQKLPTAQSDSVCDGRLARSS